METTEKVNPDSIKKMESSKNITVSFKESKSKIEFKQKGHKEGRMKVTLKFGKDEAEGFVNFCSLAKPENMSQDDFAKFLFYKGVQALQQDFATQVEKYKTEHPEEFAKVQADLESMNQPIEDGSVTVADETPQL